MPSVVGHQPRPWVIVSGIPEDSDLGRHIKRVAGTCRFVETEDDARLRQSDYDAAIVVGDAGGFEDHLMLLRIGSSHTSVSIPGNLSTYRSLNWAPGSFAG